MKITNNQLKQIIKEELENAIGVQEGEMRELRPDMVQIAQGALAAVRQAEELASSQSFDKSMGDEGPKSFKLQSALQEASRIIQDALSEYRTTYLQE